MKSLSHARFFATPLTIAYQAPPSMGFSRQEYWSGLPFPPTGDLPHPGIQPGSPTWQTDALPSEPPGKPLKKLGGSKCQGLSIWLCYSCYLFAKSCPTLCDPMDCSLPGSSVYGISQARILGWVAIFFSRGFSWPRDHAPVSCLKSRLFTTELPGKPHSTV